MGRNLRLALWVMVLWMGITLPVQAQKNNIEGIIITLQNDSVRGMIDYREWTINPDLIRFTSSDGTVSIFTPDKIKGFVIRSKDRYISFKTSLDLTSTKIDDVATFHEPKSVKDTSLFLLVLVKGKASLYYLKDKNNREHFYVTKGEEPPVELLIRKNYKTSSEGGTSERTYMTTLELFKGQLIVLLNDCPSLKDLINRSAFNSSSLSSIIIRYNKSFQSDFEYVKKEEKVKLHVGALAGLSIVSLAFTGGEGDQSGPGLDLADVKMAKSTTFTAGVSLHIVFPRNRASWSLINELVYRPYSTSGNKSYDNWIQGSYKYHFTFDMGYIKLNTLLRYQYPAWKVHPFADLGISNGFAVQSGNSETVERTNILNVTTTENKAAIDDIRKYEFGIIGGLGVSWWKLNGEIRYEWAQGVSPYEGMRGPENTWSLILAYIF